MILHPLANARWGFESSCYVCSPANERRLQVPFLHDDEAGAGYVREARP